MVPSSSTPNQDYKASLRALRSLHHAFSYLQHDTDAARLIAKEMLQQEHEHRRSFGKAGKHHHCKDCAKYYSHGSERPRYSSSFVPTTPKSGIRVEMDIHIPTPPSGLLIALSWSAGWLKSADFLRVCHLIFLGSECCCGVFGGGIDGGYEWFIWTPSNPAKLQTSNAGYGCTATALREVLNAAHERGDM